jgi:hypothetical protein
MSKGRGTAVVISDTNSHGTYFQVYDTPPNGTTYLIYSCLWSSEANAVKEFDQQVQSWTHNMEQGA